jgi:hypothetical protein
VRLGELTNKRGDQCRSSGFCLRPSDFRRVGLHSVLGILCIRSQYASATSCACVKEPRISAWPTLEIGSSNNVAVNNEIAFIKVKCLNAYTILLRKE